ncbi:hypothetical protein [Terrabacter sp. 2RAF25]|uniref:hypothetical protein n=1 Tax=Terrabacter sp. 2RAF25 TaxID=3232998 RepID=UPI003F967196
MVDCPIPGDLDEFEGFAGRPAFASAAVVRSEEMSHCGEETGVDAAVDGFVGLGVGVGSAAVDGVIGSAVVVGTPLGITEVVGVAGAGVGTVA